MKISIISPCYNSQNNISQMIESVLSQEYCNYELILVNDGSTDNTKDIIEEFKVKSERIVAIHQENSGKPSIARNVGIKSATGDIICFLDSDDTMLPNKLQRVAEHFLKHKDINFVVHDFLTIDRHNSVSEQGVVASQWDSRDLNKALTKEGEHYLSQTNIYEYFLSKWVFLHVNTVAFRRAKFNQSDLMFDEKLLFAEDINKWCDMIIKEPFHYISEPLATYRDTPNSLMEDTLKADIAALTFVLSHRKTPLIALSEQTKAMLDKKIVKETKDVIYQSAMQREANIFWHHANTLLKRQCSIKNIIFIGKSLLKFAGKN